MLAPKAAESCAAVLDGGDALEVRLERLRSPTVDRRRVQIGGIIIGDPTLVAAGGGAAAHRVGDDRVVALLDQHRGGEEGADRGAIGRDRMVTPPGAVGILIEAVAGLDRFVDAGEIDADAALGGLRGEAAGDGERNGGEEGKGTAHAKTFRWSRIAMSPARTVKRHSPLRPSPLIRCAPLFRRERRG